MPSASRSTAALMENWAQSDDDDDAEPVNKSERAPARRMLGVGQAVGLLRRPRIMPSVELTTSSAAAPAPSEDEVTEEMVSDPARLAALAAQRLADNEPEIRLAAIEVLSRSPKLSEYALPISLRLDDELWYVRRAAILALTHVAPLSAHQALDYLLPRLGDPKEEVRTAALEKLGRVDDMTAVQSFAGAMTRATYDTHWPARSAAVAVLAKMDVSALAAHDSVARVACCLTDTASGVRLAALEALSAWGADVLAPYRADIERMQQSDAVTDVRMVAERIRDLHFGASTAPSAEPVHV